MGAGRGHAGSGPGQTPVSPLVYVHVPKAAGTSLKDVIARVYAPRPMLFFLQGTGELERFRAMPPAARARCAAVAGHEPFGLQRVYDGCGVEPAVITVLREPVARVVSLYRYIFREPAHPLHTAFVEGGVSIAEVFSRFTPEAFDNHQVRYLAGPTVHGKAFGTLTGDDLALAKQNLSEGCRAFGLQERFAESMEWFARELGWPTVGAGRLNESPERGSRDSGPNGPGGASGGITDADRAMIAERNALDVDLHRFASRLFDERAGVRRGDSDDPRMPA